MTGAVCEPQLRALAERLETNRGVGFRFREHDAHSPLPRAYQWADGSAYVNHVELVRKARGAEMPASFWTDPLMYQGGADAILPPRDPIPMAGRGLGHRHGGRGRRHRGRRADGRVRRRRRALHPPRHAGERCVAAQSHSSGTGQRVSGSFSPSRPSAFSPVAVTPDELGEAWDGGKLSLPLIVDLNGKPLRPRAGRCRHDVRLPHADRPRRQDAAADGGHYRRLRHGLEQRRGRRAWQAHIARAASATPASPKCA